MIHKYLMLVKKIAPNFLISYENNHFKSIKFINNVFKNNHH